MAAAWSWGWMIDVWFVGVVKGGREGGFRVRTDGVNFLKEVQRALHEVVLLSFEHASSHAVFLASLMVLDRCFFVWCRS